MRQAPEASWIASQTRNAAMATMPSARPILVPQISIQSFWSASSAAEMTTRPLGAAAKKAHAGRLFPRDALENPPRFGVTVAVPCSGHG